MMLSIYIVGSRVAWLPESSFTCSRGPRFNSRPGIRFSLMMGSIIMEGVSNASEEAFLSGEMSQWRKYCCAPGLNPLPCPSLAYPALQGTMRSRTGSLAKSGLISRRQRLWATVVAGLPLSLSDHLKTLTFLTLGCLEKYINRGDTSVYFFCISSY